MAQVNLWWVKDKVFVGADSNNHSIVIGRTGGDNPTWQGVKPSDLLLLAVASCSAFDVVEILTKQREQFSDLHVECSGEQMSEAPYSFTKIKNQYLVTGKVNPQKLEKAIRLSEDKYCSVINSLGSHVAFSSDFEIVE